MNTLWIALGILAIGTAVIAGIIHYATKRNER